MTNQHNPFTLLGIGLLATIGYFYFAPKLLGNNSNGKKLNESPFNPFPPMPPAQAVTSQGPPLPMGVSPMGPQTMIPPPMPPSMNNTPDITLQNGAIPLSPQGLPPTRQPRKMISPPTQGPPPLHIGGQPMFPAQQQPIVGAFENMNFSGATFAGEDVGLGYGFPLAGVI